VFVVGGGAVYAALLSCCGRALVTQVDAAADAADTYFPNLDAHPGWALAEAGDWLEENGLRYRYCEYRKKV
jgi:dihydrofolate reductase